MGLLPTPKNPIKKLKNLDFWVSGVWGGRGGEGGCMELPINRPIKAAAMLPVISAGKDVALAHGH